MVSPVINGHLWRRWTNSAAGCGGAPLQGGEDIGNPDEPDAVRPTLKSSEEARAEYETGEGPDQGRGQRRAGGGASMDAGTQHATAQK